MEIVNELACSVSTPTGMVYMLTHLPVQETVCFAQWHRSTFSAEFTALRAASDGDADDGYCCCSRSVGLRNDVSASTEKRRREPAGDCRATLMT